MNTTSKTESREKMILSSEELFAYRKPQDKTLPKTGIKNVFPDGSLEQQNRLDQFRKERRCLLHEQRVDKIGNFVKGEWNPEKELVELDKELGKFWAYMGFVDKKRKWLYPEEALFLMETNQLETSYCGAPLSIQQSYSSLLGGSRSLEEYQVYAHLRRYGFVVLRHRGDVTRYERQIGLDKTCQRKRRNRNKNQKESKRTKTEGENAQSRDTGNKSTIDMEITDESSDFESKTKDFSSQGDSFVVANKTEKTTELSSLGEEPTKNRFPHKQVDFSDISLPCVFGLEEITLPHIIPELSPLDEKQSSEMHCIKLSTFPLNTAKQGNVSHSEPHTQPDLSSLQFSFPAFMGKSRYNNIKAKNWQDYKVKVNRLERKLYSTKQSESPCAVLWSGDVTPLVSPSDAQSTSSLLTKLRVIKELDPCPHLSKDPTDDLQIVYDVYQPDSNFKKSTPGLPHFRIYVQTCSTEPPSLSDILKATEKFMDNVPLLCAVLDCGEICLYDFMPFSLPIDINIG